MRTQKPKYREQRREQRVRIHVQRAGRGAIGGRHANDPGHGTLIADTNHDAEACEEQSQDTAKPLETISNFVNMISDRSRKKVNKVRQSERWPE